MKPLVIVGAAGFGRVIAWLVSDINKSNPEWDFKGFIDDGKELGSTTLEGYSVLGNFESIFDMKNKPWVAFAIGDTVIRKKLMEQLIKNDICIATLIHPMVWVSDYSSIGFGSIITYGSMISTGAKVGKGCLINVRSVVGHDAELFDYVSLMTGVHIAGNTIVGEGTYIGQGTNVNNDLKVGNWVTIGSGATVINDLPDNIVAVGTPAKIIKSKNGAN